MLKLSQALLIASLLILGSLVHASDAKLYTYSQLLLNPDSTSVKAGAKAIHSQMARSKELTDLAAFMLHESLNGRKALTNDTQAWLAKAIGASGNKRYLTFLKNTLELNHNRQYAKHTNNAIRQLKRDAKTSFIANEYDIQPQLQKLALLKQQLSRPSNEVVFDQIRPGDAIDAVLDKMGVTDKITISTETKYNPWSGAITISLVNLNYPIGNIIFSYEQKQGNTFRVKSIARNYANQTKPQPTKAIEQSSASSREPQKPSKATKIANHPILSSNVYNIKPYVQQLYRSGNATPLDLDAAAERLYMDMHNGEIIDSLAWICRLIGQSANPRYQSVLKEVINSKAHKKLRKYAKKALNELDDSSAKQYLKGDIYKN